jgi:CheY-like chemotaxis protein
MSRELAQLYTTGTDKIGRSAKAGQPPGDAAGHDAASGACVGRELRILLIEDSAMLRARLVNMLTESGTMRVTATAETEHEARRRIEADEYDVLLVDVQLRQGNGIEAIRHARQFYDSEHQPLIIVLTNYPLPQVRSRCMAAGADYFLDKMHQFEEVKPLIAAAAPLPR